VVDPVDLILPKWAASVRFRSRAEARSRPNGFSTTIRAFSPADRVLCSRSARGPILVGPDREIEGLHDRLAHQSGEPGPAVLDGGVDGK
jgi:hypothetical protein